MFEKLTERLERSLKMLKGEHKISEINVADTLKEVRRSLIEADVNYKVAKAFDFVVSNIVCYFANDSRRCIITEF